MSAQGAPAILAVDAGSSRLRASIVALEDGTVLEAGSRPTHAPAGELDVDALWRDLTDIVCELARRDADVRGIAVGAQLGLVLADHRGRAVRPAILWGDVRADREAEELAETLPADAAAVTGRRMTAELPIAKLRWLCVHEPGAMRRARWLLSLKDAIVHRLTGRPVSDETHASYSGLFDVHARAWSNTVCSAVGIDPVLLPTVAAGADRAGGLAADAAAALGMATGLPVAVGGPDGTLGLVGAQAVRPGVTVDVAGTTDVLLRTIERPLSDPSGAAVLNAHVIPGLWTTGGPTGLTGGAVEWTARLLGFASARDAVDALGAAADAVDPVDAPVFVTALAGTRFPSWSTDRTGVVTGLRPDHGPAHLLRAAQIGAAFTVGDGLEAIRELGLDCDEVVVVGGAAARASTLQLRCDAWSTRVIALANREATTIGAAILGGVAVGAFPNVRTAADALVRRASSHEPRPEAAAALAAARVPWRAVAGTPTAGATA